jgi:hypothetical protein
MFTSMRIIGQLWHLAWPGLKDGMSFEWLVMGEWLGLFQWGFLSLLVFIANYVIEKQNIKKCYSTLKVAGVF